MNTFGKRIKAIRENRNLPQKKVAEALGISNVQLSRYESGDRKPDLEMVKAIADYYDVDTDYLLGRDSKDKKYDPLSEIEKMVSKLGIEGLFFQDIEAWKNFTPEDVEELRKHFEWVAHKAKERNNKNET